MGTSQGLLIPSEMTPPTGIAARLRKEAKTDAKSADQRGPHGSRSKNSNSQSISQIGICENYNAIMRTHGSIGITVLAHDPGRDAGRPAVSPESLSVFHLVPRHVCNIGITLFLDLKPK